MKILLFNSIWKWLVRDNILNNCPSKVLRIIEIMWCNVDWCVECSVCGVMWIGVWSVLYDRIIIQRIFFDNNPWLQSVYVFSFLSTYIMFEYILILILYFLVLIFVLSISLKEDWIQLLITYLSIYLLNVLIDDSIEYQCFYSVFYQCKMIFFLSFYFQTNIIWFHPFFTFFFSFSLSNLFLT